ncbi:FtsQ-type POTRA domain-containing protein [Corynebacterium pseudotuberculosis]|uniref:FtsQ-type POTRA domain-containing protein n=1 Tax=Corynebacterium pseudotuberculosis 258 TaxID=1168865 RepID=A0AAU8PL19_CORPS|nr:FtsQ-type POTRA domain-containing protein [Corynebacterium pseudotuberculosis]AER69432.1 Cell division protein FtsQ [Corynebacterium pseudotuberculosis 1/06-A]AEQ06945.2 FtsQ-type POTRA domain-containing protein [Corynebacterium pseudotuberculosis CIP 52.97]AFB72747.1 FtsQ-type POTRA domain-containing protein [Corynebacterium pseudotuberculosis 316]AFK17040.1 FtsQ-type POTRA domain-containing protein [Corynebacterium pseudotuberculosis 258]AKS13730.1 Cell division protein ftsQ [Corynebacter
MKKKTILGSIGVLVAVALVTAVLFVVPVIKVSGFDVEGNIHTPQEEITAATGITVGSNLLRIDATKAATGVSRLPWVASASVDRAFPQSVKIKVTEHQAVLFAERSDGDHLFDGKGRVFVIDTHPHEAIRVTGQDDDTSPAYAAVGAMIEGLSSEIRAQIESVSAPSAYELKIQLKDGRSVYWGSQENLKDKAVALKNALTRPEQSLDVSGAPLIAVK